LGNIKKADALMGSPTQPLREYLKSMAHIRRLDEMSKTIDTLKKELETLKNSQL
jgi:UDP-3-O-[3-hydroxymyristoyl] glucosamine N-acyltransferase